MNKRNRPINEIRHADWPFILVHLFIYTVLMVIVGWVLDGAAETGGFFLLTAFLFLVTSFHLYRLRRMETEHLQHKVQAIGEIQTMLPMRAPIRPMTGWAATPELAITVLRQIILKKPSTIVELGSGVTTVINGYGLEKYNPAGKLYSLDHDQTYAEVTRNEIEMHGLNQFVELAHAPLKDVEVNGQTFHWYDLSQFNPDTTIDLLIVDGPPVETVEFARYPALPLLKNYLAETCTIVIHDTNRKQEAEIVERWLREYPDFKVSIKQTDKGICVLTRY